MRTRNQSNRLQPTVDQQQVTKRKRNVRVSETTSVADQKEKLSKRVKKGFEREDVGLESELKPEIGSNGDEKVKRAIKETTSGVDATCDTPVKADDIVGVGQHSNPLNNADADDNDFDWEDGDIPILSSSNDCRENITTGVSVEFDVLPGPAKRKAVRRATAEEKEVAEYIHKVHLLCLLGRGRLIDAACSDPLVQASLLSLLPAHLLNIADAPKLTASRLSSVVSWFHKYFRVRSPSVADKSCHLALASTLEIQEGTPEVLAALSVALFRALNLTSRFVSILDVVSFKPDADSCESTPNKLVSKGERNIFNSSTLTVARKSHSLESNSEHEPVIADNSNVKKSDTEPSLQKSEGLKRKGDLEFEMQLEMALSSTAVESSRNSPGTSSSTQPSGKMKKIRVEESQKCSSSSSGGVSIAIGSKKVGAPLYWAEVFCRGENLTGKWVHVDVVNGIIDGEYKVEAAAAACKKSLRYVVAFAGNGAKDVTRRYCTKWYKVASQRINPIWWDTVVGPLKELESAATNCVEENSFVSSRSYLEDMELQTRALTEPLPTNQQAYKNHHLYVIERWLKKYEILYPKGPVLGFCSGHAVYPRTCVQVIHTRERWLRLGLQVKAGELPVKVLNRSLKNGKQEDEKDDECLDGDDHERSSTDLYGKWQTEPLCLPHAVNGIVPKNERGRVDVWCEKSLPPGTIHLRLPRVARIARRLEIDFAEAMVGFEYRNGGSVPVFEGIVVCSEFKDVILEAYAEEEGRREAEEKRRNEAQALSRWYQLLSSIITRQRLNNRYGNGVDNASLTQVSADIPKSEENNSKSAAAAVTKKVACHKKKTPKEQSHGTSSSAFVVKPDENHEHEFVLEEREADEDGSTRVKRCLCGFSIEFEEL